MQLRRLAALEQQKIQDEHKQVQEIISHLEDLLANPKKILALIKEDMVELEKAYGDERRTEIEINELGEFNEEDLVKDEAVFISITQRGYIKRVVAEAFRAQGRGGKGVKGHATKEEDEVNIFMPARTKETILFFSNRGKVYSEKTYRIPEASRTAKGSSIFNLLNLEPEETITAALRVKDFKNSEYCILATRNGKTKRVALSEFSSVRPSGLIAMNLNDDDELGWVQLTSGEDEIIFVSENGQALRFKEDSVRAMGRQAAGVKGINLRGDDKVTSMEVLREGYDLLIITTNGYGKRTPLDQYNAKGRATMGVKTIDTNAIHIVGKIAGAKVVKPSDNLTIISSNGVVLRTKVEDIKQAGRATRGVKVINLGEGDSVASTARMAEESIEDITEESNEEDSDAKEKDANDLKE